MIESPILCGMHNLPIWRIKTKLRNAKGDSFYKSIALASMYTSDGYLFKILLEWLLPYCHKVGSLHSKLILGAV